jgi:hypothetical protein
MQISVIEMADNIVEPYAIKLGKVRVEKPFSSSAPKRLYEMENTDSRFHAATVRILLRLRVRILQGWGGWSIPYGSVLGSGPR